MRLADRIAQCQTPLIVGSAKDGSVTRLNGAAELSGEIQRCATRFVLSDELTRLCTALAYSKGAKTLDCEDLLHIPAERVWMEWTEAPWRTELARYGFKNYVGSACSGRRGAFIQSNPDGRSGLMRTFWTAAESQSDVLSSSMEAYFDFDAPKHYSAPASDPRRRRFIRVSDDGAGAKDNILRRCFGFWFERSWQDYYEKARLTPHQMSALSRHALGTIAIDIPMILSFFLLLGTRPSLPRRPLMLEKINQSRSKFGKATLLDQIEVSSPLLQNYRTAYSNASGNTRATSRLHHVRGHLVRRGSCIFWRVPHLRGSARAGVIRTRTVTWTIDPPGKKAGSQNVSATKESA